MHVKDRKAIGNSQCRFTELHLSSVITYYDEMAGSEPGKSRECHLLLLSKDFH